MEARYFVIKLCHEILLWVMVYAIPFVN